MTDSAPDPTPDPGHTADRPPAAVRRAAAAEPGQVVVAVLLGIVGFAAITQVRAYEVDDTYAGVPRAGADRRPQRPGRHLAAGPGRDHPARAGARRPPVEHAVPPGRPRPGASAGRHPRHPGRHGARDRTGDPDHHRGGRRPGRHRLAARHRPGAAQLRRRGHAVQRRGPGGGADRVRGRGRRHRRRRHHSLAAVRHRRDRRTVHPGRRVELRGGADRPARGGRRDRRRRTSSSRSTSRASYRRHDRSSPSRTRSSSLPSNDPCPRLARPEETSCTPTT